MGHGTIIVVGEDQWVPRDIVTVQRQISEQAIKVVDHENAGVAVEAVLREGPVRQVVQDRIDRRAERRARR